MNIRTANNRRKRRMRDYRSMWSHGVSFKAYRERRNATNLIPLSHTGYIVFDGNYDGANWRVNHGRILLGV